MSGRLPLSFPFFTLIKDAIFSYFYSRSVLGKILVVIVTKNKLCPWMNNRKCD